MGFSPQNAGFKHFLFGTVSLTAEARSKEG